MSKVKHIHHHHGIGIGTVIAVLLSWGANESVLWALIHGFFGWFYVLYYFITN